MAVYLLIAPWSTGRDSHIFRWYTITKFDPVPSKSIIRAHSFVSGASKSGLYHVLANWALGLDRNLWNECPARTDSRTPSEIQRQWWYIHRHAVEQSNARAVYRARIAPSITPVAAGDKSFERAGKSFNQRFAHQPSILEIQQRSSPACAMTHQKMQACLKHW